MRVDTYIFFAILHLISAYNLDEKFPIIYEEPSSHSIVKSRPSYFGYSVILNPSRDYTESWIQIGAPRANMTGKLRGIKEPGAVYRCPLWKPCKIFVVDDTGNDRRIGPTRYSHYVDRKDGAWIGGAMDIDYKSNRVAVCGHRWMNQQKNKHNDYYMEGVCYISNNNKTMKLIPLNDNSHEIYSGRNFYAYYYPMGQAGISVHFPDYHKEPQMIAGAPGVLNWAGTTILFKDGDELPTVPNRRRRQIDNISPLNKWIIPDPELTSDTWHFYYTGYQVTSGRYFSRNQIVYVTGCPRGNHCKGQILLFTFPSKSNGAISVLNKFQGQYSCEYFGSVLATADITGDGLDDLIVGAPYYASDWDEGRIYVFLGSSRGTLLVPDQSPTISGKIRGARFGSAIMSLSDLDKDGFDDIVVGAPYEDDHRGAIYIYNGSPLGLFETYSQKIVAKNVYDHLRGFGISFSRAVDIDNNFYNDIAVGSYLSGQAVIFRSKPVIMLDLTLQTTVNSLDRKAKKFVIEACHWFSGSDVPFHIEVQRYLTVDEEFSRAHLIKKDVQSINTETLILYEDSKNCTNITIFLEKNITNFVDPIRLSLRQSLFEKEVNGTPIIISDSIKGTDNLCHKCAVINKRSSSKEQYLDIPFVLACGDDNICTSDLKLNVSFTGVRNDQKYVIGSRDTLYLNMSIINVGEPAYLATINITLPKSVNLFEFPSAFVCEVDNNNNVVCLIDNPLLENIQKNLILELDMKNVGFLYNNLENSVYFNMVVTTKSDEINPKDNVKNISLSLVREADTYITDISKHGVFVYTMNTDEMSIVDNITFQHYFEIHKSGASPIDEVYINISVPTHWKTSDKNTQFLKIYEPEGSFSGQPFLCQSNIEYLVKSQPKFERMVELGDSQFLRKKRSNKKSEKFEVDTSVDSGLPPANRTLFLNCSSENVVCNQITCVVGPFRYSHQFARLQLKMVIKMGIISEQFLGEKDIIYLSTDGYVQIKSPVIPGDKKRYNMIRVSSTFNTGFTKPSIPLWIILLAVIIGLFLLLLIVGTLIKAGFFQRKKKDELMALKEAEVENEFEVQETNEDYDTQTISSNDGL